MDCLSLDATSKTHGGFRFVRKKKKLEMRENSKNVGSGREFISGRVLVIREIVGILENFEKSNDVFSSFLETLNFS